MLRPRNLKSYHFGTQYMMTSSNVNILRVTGRLCGEFIDHRWILRTKASDAELYNEVAGDLRRHRAHYDVIVMNDWIWPTRITMWIVSARRQYAIQSLPTNHDDVIICKHFPRYLPFVRGIHRYPVNSPHTGQWHGALMFSLICVWINDWVNNREASDLRRYRTHYDVILM